MNLPEVFHASAQEQKGLTLLELLLVVSLVLVVGTVMLPFGITFFRSQLLDEAHSNMIESLREAYTYSRSGKHESPHGVRFFSNSYVRFAGETYDARDQTQDHTVYFSSHIALQAPQEVNFALLSGIPNASATITLHMDNATKTIQITDVGLITP